MNPSKVDRAKTHALTDLPNVGPAIARDLELIGIHRPLDLEGKDPYELYESLCAKSHARHDPCVLDTLMSIVDFVSGGDPRPWYEYTVKRKKR